jgi:arylformamidase
MPPLESSILYDISPPVSQNTGVFPGDQPFELINSLDFSKGHNLRLHSFRSTLHLGAHADAPSHYSSHGVTMEQVSVLPYLGACEVVTAKVGAGERVGLNHLPVGFVPKTPRVLLRTLSFPNPDQWNSNFASVEPSLFETWAELGVVLVGIDTPSVDPESSKDLPSHAAVAKHKFALLEGLVLTAVPDGIYELIALPLRLVGADASPVRAILRTLERTT